MGGDGGVIANKREFVRGCRNKGEEEAKVEVAKFDAVTVSYLLCTPSGCRECQTAEREPV